MQISPHAISTVIYLSIHSNGSVSSQEVHWLTRLLTEALSISRQNTRDHEINMPPYREFCGDVAVQLGKPEFEGWQDSFTFTSQRCYDTQREKQKGARDDTSCKFLSGRSMLILRLHNSIVHRQFITITFRNTW